MVQVDRGCLPRNVSVNLTEDVNALGFGKRTEKQIEQKIRDEIKALKEYDNAVKREASKTGGGRAVLSRLSAAQMRAYQALETKPRLTGLANAPEVGPRTSMKVSQVRSEDELPPPPPKKVSKAVSKIPDKPEPKNT
ncbi:hypothetical protein Y032_0083g1614, partial [Ancylostoma ceylanicum]